MFENTKKLSNWVRAQFGIPSAKEPLPDLMEMEELDLLSGKVIYYPKELVEALQLQFSPLTAPVNATLGAWTSYNVYYTVSRPHNSPKPDTEPFEMNMVEALVGWRAWKLDLKSMALRSQNSFFRDDEKHLLRPCVPMIACCGKRYGANPPGSISVFDPAGVLPEVPVHEVPAEFCTCGVYAKDTLEEVVDAKYDGIYGQVYGWGRYVRGDQGWRAQYAYPKRFYLTRDFARAMTPETVDFLRTYRVPIFVEQPTMIYNPEEDGYEYRSNEENWNFGADPESDAEED